MSALEAPGNSMQTENTTSDPQTKQEVQDYADMDLKTLAEVRQKLEEELKTLVHAIEPLVAKNYHKDLVDADGFPRDDLDYAKLHDYRVKKKRANEITNDLKVVQKNLENKLFCHHETVREIA